MKRRIKLWYHLKMLNFYSKSLDVLFETAEEDEYLECYEKFMQHEEKVRELKGA